MSFNESNLKQNPFFTETVKTFLCAHGLTMTSFFDDWVFEVRSKERMLGHIYGTDIGLNSATSSALATDKAATGALLEHSTVPVVPHHLLLRPDSPSANRIGHSDSLPVLFENCAKDVVCKPNEGASGRDVIRATTLSTFKEAVMTLFSTHRSVAVSPFVSIAAEYRVTILNGEPLLAYEKVRTDADALHFNLSHGAHARTLVKTEMQREILQLAKNATQTLGLHFANVDVVQVGKQFLILEVNAKVSFERYVQQGAEEQRRAEEVYHHALACRFLNACI